MANKKQLTKQRIVQARLDDNSSQQLDELTEALSLSESDIIREALKLIRSCSIINNNRRIIGLGKFKSNKSDLGSNKSHLSNFGRR